MAIKKTSVKRHIRKCKKKIVPIKQHKRRVKNRSASKISKIIDTPYDSRRFKEFARPEATKKELNKVFAGKESESGYTFKELKKERKSTKDLAKKIASGEVEYHGSGWSPWTPEERRFYDKIYSRFSKGELSVVKSKPKKVERKDPDKFFEDMNNSFRWRPPLMIAPLRLESLDYQDGVVGKNRGRVFILNPKVYKTKKEFQDDKQILNNWIKAYEKPLPKNISDEERRERMTSKWASLASKFAVIRVDLMRPFDFKNIDKERVKLYGEESIANPVIERYNVKKRKEATEKAFRELFK